MKIVAVVPMKLNNRRLPQKNTRPFTNGKPLCYYILKTLLNCKKIEEVYVYCSNEDIKDFIPDGVKYLKRSESLDQDTTKMNEVLAAFEREIKADIYVMTHTTAPFISVDSIEKGIDAVASGKYDSSFAAKKLQDFLWKDGAPFNYELNNIPRTQDLAPLFEETSGFYIYKNEVMSLKNRRIGDHPFIVEVSEIESIDIDELEDFKIADAIYNFYFKEEIKSKQVYVLDCTLRDGGYVNSWIFGNKNIKRVISGLEESKVDIIECGFVTNKGEYVLGSTKFKSIEQVNSFLQPDKSTKCSYAVMINYGQYNLDDIPNYCGYGVDSIRVAFHKVDLINALDFCKCIKKKGYKVFVQAMVSLSYSDNEYKYMIKKCNEFKPYALYIVDSFGVMKKEEVLHYYKMLESELDNQVFVGFHAHNNVQLAYSNAISLIECSSRDIIIDSSIHGMGRGAGNLNTEIFIEYINNQCNGQYKLKPILEVSDQVIEKIYAKYHWGYSLPNYLSAKYNCHPNYASYLNEKNNLTLSDMNAVFEMLDQNKKVEFDKEYIESLYDSYLESKDRANDDFSKVFSIFNDKNVIMVCPGKSSIDKLNILNKHIKDDSIIVSINFNYELITPNYIFVGNNKRMKEIDTKLYDKVISTTNIPNNDVFAKINYSSLLNNNNNVRDNTGLMFISLMKQCRVNSLVIIGMDGYRYNSSDNYMNDELMMIESADKIDRMNAGITELLEEYGNMLKIIKI